MSLKTNIPIILVLALSACADVNHYEDASSQDSDVVSQSDATEQEKAIILKKSPSNDESHIGVWIPYQSSKGGATEAQSASATFRLEFGECVRGLYSGEYYSLILPEGAVYDSNENSLSYNNKVYSSGDSITLAGGFVTKEASSLRENVVILPTCITKTVFIGL